MKTALVLILGIVIGLGLAVAFVYVAPDTVEYYLGGN
jgi:uncharacterized protein involved in exopolysaccharide biosynthesis